MGKVFAYTHKHPKMKIIIIGAGFAGLKLARTLNNKPGIEVLLLDRNNYHQFQPLFYQVATAGLDASNISFPLRKIFHKSKNVRIRLAKVIAIQEEEKNVITDIGNFSYDQLVIATGADTNFFGNEQLSEKCFAMKSTVEALQIRHRLIQNIEDALVIEDKATRQQLMTIVIVGGGPTGVELAGAIAEMKKYNLPYDFPEMDFSSMKIILVEATANTLNNMSEKSHKQSKYYLEKLGVTVILNTFLKDYNGETVLLSSGETIQAATVIWAAGISGNIPGGIEPELIAKGRRIIVDRFNCIVGKVDIYAVGDVALMKTPTYALGHPQVANVAIHQAKNLAENFLRQNNANKDRINWKEFEYADKGSMATVGRHLAVVDLPNPKIHFGGLLAWLVWMFLHLMLILGVKNKLQTFINWAYNYLTFDQSLRLIFKEFYKPIRKNTVG